ncbi:hypothetical protein TorRG33x02_267450, partial [Trema orientale]
TQAGGGSNEICSQRADIMRPRLRAQTLWGLLSAGRYFEAMSPRADPMGSALSG